MEVLGSALGAFSRAIVTCQLFEQRVEAPEVPFPQRAVFLEPVARFA
jgi:hypothetical protein